MSGLTRGPLPPRVYWVRRLVVLATAVLLVVAIARLLGDGSDASDGAAEQTSALTAPTGGSSAGTSSPASGTKGKGKKGSGKKGSQGKPGKGASTSASPVLAEPEGDCVGSDVVVVPVVGDAVAGRDVTLTLQLRTMESPACTFEVSPRSVTLTITTANGERQIWTSRDCPSAIEPQEVVVRNNATTTVKATWAGARRSDASCSLLAGWPMPGTFRATSAALGGQPADVEFELTTPVAETITKTATPTQSPTSKPSGKPKPGSTGTKKPKQSPSGAVEPG